MTYLFSSTVLLASESEVQVVDPKGSESMCRICPSYTPTGIMLAMGSANESRRYNVTSSLIV